MQTVPIFLYSGFRASSTWLWSKFRQHEGLLCYYEPFNEQLANLTCGNITEARPDGWRSHHPAGVPYLLEYAGMLEEDVGVPGFPAAASLGGRYIGAAGPDGQLDEDVAAYVQGLIDHAGSLGRMPLLACTRMLGRAHGFKAAFGGYHILLVRNLFHQWNSYAGQARFGNWYFFQTLYETLELSQRDPVVAYLARIFPEEVCSSLQAWVQPDNFDRVFCYFVGFHLYYLTLARRASNIVVNVNALASNDVKYRQEIVAKIAHGIGVELDLSDASEQVDFPIHPIADYQTCMVAIEESATTIKSAFCNDPLDSAFINDLITELWKKQTIFYHQTKSAFEYCEHRDRRIAEILAEISQFRMESESDEAKFGGLWKLIDQLK